MAPVYPVPYRSDPRTGGEGGGKEGEEEWRGGGVEGKRGGVHD